MNKSVVKEQKKVKGSQPIINNTSSANTKETKDTSINQHMVIVEFNNQDRIKKEIKIISEISKRENTKYQLSKECKKESNSDAGFYTNDIVIITLMQNYFIFYSA